MKKLLNILVLLIFVNFTALPGIAKVFGWEIPQTNMIVSEEENHSAAQSVVFEKVIPQPLNVHDFLRFFETVSHEKAFVMLNDGVHLSPYLTIFSPPPEA